MQPKLTRREKEIFNLLLEGNVPKEIAGKLKITYDTVTFHQGNIYKKLDVHSIDELLEKYQGKKTASIDIAGKPPVIFLEDGTYFTVHTFNNVYLYQVIFLQLTEVYI